MMEKGLLLREGGYEGRPCGVKEILSQTSTKSLADRADRKARRAASGLFLRYQDFPA